MSRVFEAKDRLRSPSAKKDGETEHKARSLKHPSYQMHSGEIVILCYCACGPCFCYEDGFDMSGAVDNHSYNIRWR